MTTISWPKDIFSHVVTETR